MSALKPHQQPRQFRRQNITSGYGFLQGIHNARGWDHSQHGQLLQTENTQYLLLHLYHST